jgi:hypothetical protein
MTLNSAIQSGATTDFFISYTGNDEQWAEWIAWTLEAAGFSVIYQKWDFRPGSNFVLQMQRAAARCQRTIAVLSPQYLRSAYGAPEWSAAFVNDPEGLHQTLVPIRIAECEPDGLLKSILYIDLVGTDDDEARGRLLDGVARRRAKPSSKPAFPGSNSRSAAPSFPASHPAQASSTRYMPKIRSTPSDLETRRFIKLTFETIRQEFEERLSDLARDNTGVETDLTAVDATKFTAEIFMNGRSRVRCKIWQGGMFSEGISYAEGSATLRDGTCNEVLSLSTGGGLSFRPMMNMGLGRAGEGLDIENLSPNDSAEYLWRRFTWGLA